jgi:hypothetical protein
MSMVENYRKQLSFNAISFRTKAALTVSSKVAIVLCPIPASFDPVEFGGRQSVGIEYYELAVPYVTINSDPVFRIRINLIRIRIQDYRLNNDPDPGF